MPTATLSNRKFLGRFDKADIRPMREVTVEEFRRIATGYWDDTTIKLLLDFHPEFIPRYHLGIGEESLRINSNGE